MNHKHFRVYHLFIYMCIGMELFKSRYSDILQSLSNDYEQTLDIIQDELTDDQICSVLSCSEPTTANKLILDSLIEKAKCRADLLQLCNQLQQIMPSSPGLGCLTNVVCEIQACKNIRGQISAFSALWSYKCL